MKKSKMIAGLLALISVMTVMTACSKEPAKTDANGSVTTTVTQEQGSNGSIMQFYTNPDDCAYLRNPNYCIYYTDSMTGDKAEVYYNQGTWLMYSGDKFTQLQQYCVTDVNKTLEDVAKSFSVFNEETVTYYGYTQDNQVIELDKTKTFKESQADYIFIEWITDDYSYSYTYQSGDVSVFAVYTDSVNLFREYSKIYEELEAQQGTATGGTTGSEATTSETGAESTTTGEGTTTETSETTAATEVEATETTVANEAESADIVESDKVVNTD